MLRDLGPQQWLWEEMRDVNAMLFRFKDKERPQSLVSNLSSVMHVRSCHFLMSLLSDKALDSDLK
jgi:secreted Zn-dependent insulinase-like peptidase